MRRSSEEMRGREGRGVCAGGAKNEDEDEKEKERRN